MGWKIFRGMRLAAVFCAAAAWGVAAGAEDRNPVFHFDFKDAAGRTEFKDLTGKVSCVSKYGGLVVEGGALRVDAGAEISIPGAQIPKISDELTVAGWIAQAQFGAPMPMFFKGAHPEPICFAFGVYGTIPVFMYKNESGQNGWKGVSYTGSLSGGVGLFYKDKSWSLTSARPSIEWGKWAHIAAVFKNGVTRIYLNGMPVAENKSEAGQSLKNDNLPLYIGLERLREGPMLNYATANALMNDLRMHAAALSDAEIEGIYKSERPKYPDASLLPPGKKRLVQCPDYLAAQIKGYDPLFRNKLKITEEYEKTVDKIVPPDPVESASVETKDRQTDLVINGEKTFPFLTIPALSSDNTYDIDGAFLFLRDFAAAGMGLASTGSVGPTFWQGDGKYDWATFDKIFKSSIKANPSARIMLYFYTRPPAWFMQKYPDEMEKYCIGGDMNDLKTAYVAAPFGSEIWLATAKKMLRDVIRHVEESDYAGNVFGYLLACGDAGEWYWAGSFTGGMPGYSKATRDSFRKWLAAKYNNDPAQLRKAWSDSSADFAGVNVPPPGLRLGNEGGLLFRDPAKAAPVMDFRDYMKDATTTNLSECTKAIKDSCGGKKPVFVYYGYPMLFIGNPTSLALHMSGINDMSKVFALSQVDCLMSPLDYVRRRGGETGLNINAFNGSALLHRKMIWHEDDLRTHLHYVPEFGRTSTLEETVSVMTRGFGYALTQSAGFWLLSFENYWYHQEELMRSVSDIQKAGVAAMEKDRSSVAEVALIFDDRHVKNLAVPPEKTQFLDATSWGAYQNAARMGAPFDAYIMEDLANPAMPDYKMYVFLNAFNYSDADARMIHAKVRKNNAVSVWCYAPGYISEKGFDKTGMEKLTGIRLGVKNEPMTLALEVSDKQSPITRFVSGKFDSHKFGPVFYGDDKDAKVLGYADFMPALLVKESGDWRSVYSLTPLTKELLTGLCDYAGAHVYSRSFDVLTANKSHIMLHTSSGGMKKLSLREKSRVSEIMTGRVVAENVTEFGEELPEKTTRIYELAPKSFMGSLLGL